MKKSRLHAGTGLLGVAFASSKPIPRCNAQSHRVNWESITFVDSPLSVHQSPSPLLPRSFDLLELVVLYLNVSR